MKQHITDCHGQYRLKWLSRGSERMTFIRTIEYYHFYFVKSYFGKIAIRKFCVKELFSDLMSGNIFVSLNGCPAVGNMTFLSIMCKCILPILHSKILVRRKQNSEFLSNNNSAIKWVEIFFAGYYSEGIPSEEALLSLYCDLTGNGLPLPNWKFFLGLVFFRVIVNIQVGSALASAASWLSTVTMKLYLFSYSSSFLVSNVNQIKGHQWEYWSLSVRTVTTMTASGP